MTEITVNSAELSPAIKRFVLHWGDLGGQWGVNRSVAQIHALLLVSDKPMNAEDIAEALGLARSNVSNSVKELLTWDLVRRAPVAGDRRDHFEAESDMWEMVSRIVAMRKARELDPAAKVLDSCLTDAKEDPAAGEAAVKRLSDLQELIGLLDGWYAQMNKLPKSRLLPLIRMGTKAVDLLAPFMGKKKE
ncbi:GbsR/MarR family transcriptional regulator [Hyphococcus luteus]|uniref:HTH-type transcriptional regulator n=1 Tax=Hyphococcus luteus TaxID=2058213 RepID=A0A2S7JZB4_9PROT|nr:MarR family transcriptional regulator [Marinicaulis flavus]PQA85601.1 ArsR family transcriptional regulator [Marinicaulis flavus]